jgi:hypothetical protein
MDKQEVKVLKALGFVTLVDSVGTPGLETTLSGGVLFGTLQLIVIEAMLSMTFFD